MMSRRAVLGDFQGGDAPLIDRAEGASDIQPMVISRALAA